MRSDFKRAVKEKLAKRVAYRCSFSGCQRITIGPSTKSIDAVTIVGEAAHIHSASPNGPRNNPKLTEEERTSISNGIWMCKHHARLIDVDEINYSAETLMMWKKEAERYVYDRLQTMEREDVEEVFTLVMFGPELIIKAQWESAIDDVWELRIDSYVEGSWLAIQAYCQSFDSLPSAKRYIVIESQGDGRVLGGITWHTKENRYIISCIVQPKAPRTNPYSLGSDIAMAEDGDLMLVDGDIGMVHGIDTALQVVRTALSWEFGWWASPQLGSYFATFFNKYSTQTEILNSLVKLEVVRLLTVPIKGQFDKEETPSLNFINRVNKASVLPYDMSKPYLSVELSLEWGNLEQWNGVVKVPYDPKQNR